MKQPTSWYYSHHKPGEFVHQQELCDLVRWTKCNLEGQVLKNQNTLSAIQGNPLTIRLLALDEALQHFEQIREIEKQVEKSSREQFNKGQMFTMSGRWEAEGSIYDTQGAPVEVIEIRGRSFELHHVDIQLALYEYFTNIGSILDRLTFEVNMLFSLGIPIRNISWTTLTNTKTGYIGILQNKNVNIAGLISRFATIIFPVIVYRNRLVHDGIIKFETNISVMNFGAYLPEDPRYPDRNINVNAVNFCITMRKTVIELLEECYEQMVQHHSNHGKPPWK